MKEDKYSQVQQVFVDDGFNMTLSLKNRPTRLDFTRKVRELYNQVDLLIDSFVRRCNSEGVSVDCKLGCHWCCYQSVFASTHEMLVVMDYLHQKFSAEVIDRVKKRTSEKFTHTRKLSNNDLLKNNGLCPLLQNGACMVYPVRPMACRIYLSSDVGTCISRYHHPYDDQFRPALFQFILDAGRHMNFGFVSGLKDKGLTSNEAPLEWLLHEFMGSNDAFKKWLNGAVLNESFEFE